MSNPGSSTSDPVPPVPPTRKSLLIFFDGTANDHLDHRDPVNRSPTNVFKLFHCLNGQLHVHEPEDSPEFRQQIENEGLGFKSYYIKGVGTEKEFTTGLKSKAFGYGILLRVIRAWMWISRFYNEGDQIFLIGFSRGAYTAVIFAHLLTEFGLLDKYQHLWASLLAEESPVERVDRCSAGKESLKFMVFREAAFALVHWFLNMREHSIHPLPKQELEWLNDADYLQRNFSMWKKVFQFFSDDPFKKLVDHWPKDLRTQKQKAKSFFDENLFLSLTKTNRQERHKIVGESLILGLWDTVPAIGEIFADASGRRLLHEHYGGMSIPAAQIFHAVSLDDSRQQFTPRLFEPSPRVTQKFFPGAHADIGGGYSFLSDEETHMTKIREEQEVLVKKSPGLTLSTPTHESALSDIALGWMLKRIDDFVKAANRPSLFQPDYIDFANKVETKNWEFFRQFPVFIRLRPINPEELTSERMAKLWKAAIRLLPDPLGIAHLEGSFLFPRLFSGSIDIDRNLHPIVHLRSDGTPWLHYILNMRKDVLNPKSTRILQRYKHRPQTFTAVLTHLMGNEDDGAHCTQGSALIAAITS